MAVVFGKDQGLRHLFTAGEDLREQAVAKRADYETTASPFKNLPWGAALTGRR
jgi:hypothetical protein